MTSQSKNFASRCFQFHKSDVHKSPCGIRTVELRAGSARRDYIYTMYALNIIACLYDICAQFARLIRFFKQDFMLRDINGLTCIHVRENIREGTSKIAT